MLRDNSGNERAGKSAIRLIGEATYMDSLGPSAARPESIVSFAKRFIDDPERKLLRNAVARSPRS